MAIEYVMLGVAALLLASIVASKASGRFGVPALLVFLAIGMLAGSDGPGGIEFDYPRAAQWLGIVALAFILFAGGLETRWPAVRPVLRESMLLSTLGVALTAVIVAGCARVVLGCSFLEGMLLGSIVSSTDAAAVFGILRSKNLRLRPHLRSLLELESGSNDPMAVFLTLGMIALIQTPGMGAAGFGFMFLAQMGVGGVLGYGMGRIMALVLNRLDLEFEGLYPAVTLAMVLLTYGLAAAAGGNGFLSVYAAAIVLGNSDFLHKRSLIRFHDGLAWLMQIAMFLTLGLQVFPSRLAAVATPGLTVAFVLMFLARPAAVLLLLLGSRLSWRERILVSWVGLRGAAPIVLATFPLIAGISKAGLMFDIVFFIVLTSGLLQGSSIAWVAARLGLLDHSPQPVVDPLELMSNGERDVVRFSVGASSPANGRRIVDLALPPETLVLLVERGGIYMIPRGGTALQQGDQVLILAARDQLPAVEQSLGPAFR